MPSHRSSVWHCSMGREVSGSECEYVVLEDPDKLSGIDAHGGCQMPHFVLAFTYAQTSHPQLFLPPMAWAQSSLTQILRTVVKRKYTEAMTTPNGYRYLCKGRHGKSNALVLATLLQECWRMAKFQANVGTPSYRRQRAPVRYGLPFNLCEFVF